MTKRKSKSTKSTVKAVAAKASVTKSSAAAATTAHSIDAMLFSIDSMTTRGASGLVVQQHGQMMGALEAVDGMLLFGISTAYIFAVTDHRPS
jgi:hypothetical protein